MSASAAPYTPSKHVTLDAAKLHDSPFSDYFTDDARSISLSASGAAYDAPSTETQAMLVRLNKLQAQLMRSGEEEGGEEALGIVERKMSEIEREIGALHSQTRISIDDSGLFLEEEESPAPFARDERAKEDGVGYFGRRRDSGTEQDEDVTPEHRQAEQDFQLVEAQRVLENVTRAQEELRRRHAELVELNDAHVLQIEEREAELERLRGENEALRSDLGFDHSELLFLKLQLKGLEVELDEAHEDRGITSQIREDSKRRKRGRILEEMEKWRSDWHDVDARFRRRRSRYGVLSADGRDRTLASELDAKDSEMEEGQWQLETVKKSSSGGRRVDSITIRRLESEYAGSGVDGAADERKGEEQAAAEKADVKEPKKEPRTQMHDSGMKSYSNHSTQTNALPPTSEQASQTDLSFPPHISNSPLEEDEGDLDDECAITTSPATPEQGLSPVIQPLEGVLRQLPIPEVKTAWRELWEGLSELAGMGGEEG
jgi:hypothetical protein